MPCTRSHSETVDGGTRSVLATTLLLISAFAVQACGDQEPTLAPAEVAPTFSVQELAGSWRDQVAPEDTGTRYDAPWWYLSDEELVAAVEAAGGRVAIGFKEPNARGGVANDGTVLVSQSTANEAKEFLRSLGLEFEIEFQLIPAVSLTMSPELVPVIRGDPMVDYLEPMLPGERLAQDTTWNIDRVRAPDAWSQSTGSGADLLIIDSGVDKNHGDLDVAVIQACDGSNGLPQYEHGTQVAGVAAALDNTMDLIGASHGVSLWSSKDGDALPSPDYTACGVEFGRVNDIFSMNISSGSSNSYTPLYDQIAAAWNEGLMIVASVGNDGGSVLYPAAYSQVIGVTATDINNDRPSWANYGSEVELSAPGVSIETTDLGGGTITVDGTSLAAPHVAAAAALIKAANPGWTNSDVREALQQTAMYLGSATYYGHGLLDIAAAVVYTDLAVTIDGPAAISSEGFYTWEAMPSGGVTPYSYQWEINYYEIGTGWGNLGTEKQESFYVEGSDGNFYLRVTVTDAAGDTASWTITVSNNAGCGNQFIC